MKLKPVLLALLATSLPLEVAHAATTTELLAPDRAAFDQLGYSVDISGNTAVVGAFQDDDLGADSGSAYVFVRSGSTWVFQQKLLSFFGGPGDWFGFSVTISGDTIAVGAPYDDHLGARTGAVYMYQRTGSTWSGIYSLSTGNLNADDQFGYSVAIDPNALVVGVPGDDDRGSASGSLQIYERGGPSTWFYSQQVLATDGAAGDQLGYSVAVSGTTVAGGALTDDDSFTSTGSGYVFTKNGISWSQQAKLVAPDPLDYDFFGFSTAIDADTVVFGADQAGPQDVGAAYVYTRSGTAWSLQQKLSPSDATPFGNLFGSSVGISGNRIVVGSRGLNYEGLYVFARQGGLWSQLQKFTSPDGNNDGFGFSAALDGSSAITGATTHTHGGTLPLSGSAYVFDGLAAALAVPFLGGHLKALAFALLACGLALGGRVLRRSTPETA